MVDLVIRLVKLSLRLLEALWFYTRSIWRKMFQDDVLFLASGLAFNGVLTMIPLMLLAASALGWFLNSSELGVKQLTDVLNTIFPDQPFATSIKESIVTVISDIVRYRTSLGVFGVIVLVWTATSLFDAIHSVLHRVFELKRTRSLWVSLLHDIGFVFLVFVLFITTTFSTWVLSLAEPIVARLPILEAIDLSILQRRLPTVVILVLTGIMFYVIFRYIPDERPPKATGIISTITTTVLWVISGRIFSLYLSDFSAIGTIYGPYAFLLVLLVWIYYSSLMFVFGAIVGQVYWERQKLKESGKLERWV
jgi:membrane protein